MIHVIGVPRAGTTLLTQVISSVLDVGYINNLIAVFWKAPVYGIRLSEKLLGSDYISTFRSSYGITQGIYEPHQFGYFWHDLLGYEDFAQKDPNYADRIDWRKVRLVLNNMTEVFEKPIVFKSILASWHISEIHRILPRSCFIWIRRDPLENALSIHKMRKEYLRSVNDWASLKPLEYEVLKHKSIWDQIAGQVYYIEKTYREQLSSLPKSNYLVCSYEELCENPNVLTMKVQKLLRNNGWEADIIREITAKFETARSLAYKPSDVTKMQDALDQYDWKADS